ncbi:hypothetical protein [Nitratireductor aquibiodomus]|uniref:hypothetical protein n=1 Tax=Nitratireductor aquibiodomus TaxID=204799 RepID=UPI00046AC263|nr:hypothetical protein [Nitratireductor aquibiodomus]
MFAIYIAGNFPLEDYEKLADFLIASEVLVPAFIPAEVGLLSLDAVTYASHVDKLQTVFVPDRNIVSRLVKVVRDGGVGKRDVPTQVALTTLAVAQTANFLIDPSISFHEYGHSQGNTAANRELSLFRVADHADARQWIDLALGRRDNFVPTIPAPAVESVDLAFPLHRWRRNYVAMLKVGELLLGDLKPVGKMAALLEWMERDFLIAAPAAVLAAYLFAPIPKIGRAMKGIEAADRERAIAGIKNAAWDVTHISEVVRMAREHEKVGNRYIFVTADRVLRLVADMVMRLSITLSAGDRLEGPLSTWWTKKQAKVIGDLLAQKVSMAAEIRPKYRVSFTRERLDEMTAEGEAKIRGYLA